MPADWPEHPPYQSRHLQPITDLPGVGPATASRLARKGIATIEDLLLIPPIRYEDRRLITPIGQVVVGERVTICAEVTRLRDLGGRGRLRRTVARVTDTTGVLDVVWFGFAGQPYQVGDRLLLSGQIGTYRDERQMQNPDTEVCATDDPPQRIVPIYSETEGLRQRTMRKLAVVALNDFGGGWVGGVPASVRAGHALLSVRDALRVLHRPPSEMKGDPNDLTSTKSPPWRSLLFEEVFVFGLALALRRRLLDTATGVVIPTDADIMLPLARTLPFTLTAAQRECWQALAADLARRTPMHRLIHGEVGSGKTVLALLCAFAAARAGYQTAVMAPTEILAEQHAGRFEALLAPLGINVALLTGSATAPGRRRLNDRLALGTVPVVIGTQALLSGDVEFARLGMVIIDEQHKFGVMQRAQLVAKGDRPNVLVLTATPIPRSLALTLYGDLDVSLLRERPHGAGQVTTRAVTPDARAAAYRDAAGFMPPRGVAYVVCPRLAEGSDDKAGVHALHDEIRRELSPHWPLAKMHGQTPAPERAKILRDVDRGAVRAIVATSVIEVGLDLPNATVLIVENAESFGLSQLHQMRGRIGRQGQPALCLLIAGPDCSPEALERLQFLCSTHDGFAVAERDLQLRGPGEMLGARQSGLPNLRFARQALADPELVEQARSAAAKILDQDPNLSHPEHHWARMVTVQRWAALLGDGACG